MRIVKNKKGQFIVIGVMMIALMIISIGAIMYSAGTYYRYEQWEEYITLVEHVKLSTIRLVQISLANYTAFRNNSTLKDNLDQWQNDLKKAYPGYGVILTYDLADGTNINYSQGLASHWNEPISYSAANATFNLNITSVELEGYKFISAPFVKEEILSAVYDSQSLTIKLAVDKEGLMPITNLPESSFSLNIYVSGQWQSVDFSLNRYYDIEPSIDRFIYELYSDNLSSQPSVVSVTAIETRNIKVVANSTVT